MKIINLTTHTITVWANDQTIAQYKPSGIVARAQEGGFEPCDMGLSLPTSTGSILGIKDLPDPEPGVKYIVARAVAYAALAFGRNDLLVPKGIIRDGVYPEGDIKGCTGFLCLTGVLK